MLCLLCSNALGLQRCGKPLHIFLHNYFKWIVKLLALVLLTLLAFNLINFSGVCKENANEVCFYSVFASVSHYSNKTADSMEPVH